MAEFETTVDIAAPPEVVFDHLVTDEGMVAWMGQRAALEPTEGGVFAVDIDGSLVRGHFVHVDRPRRVVVTWGILGAEDLPPGTSTVEFDLTATATGTRLALRHHGLPEGRRAGHERGWTRFLPALATATQR